MLHIELSLVLPCYNEEFILEESVEQIFEILDNSRISYEIIFVDDHSLDKTQDVIERISIKYKDKNIKKIFHQKNIGRGGSVVDGINIAEGGVVGFIDADLEVHARYIPSCFLAIKKGYDVAIGKRVYKFYFKSALRYFMSKGYAFLMRRLLHVNIEDTETGFKFFNKASIIPILNQIKEKGWFWDTEIMVRAYMIGYKIKEIPCVYLKNFKKPSTVKEIKDTMYYLKKLVNFRNLLKKEKINNIIKEYWVKNSAIFPSFYASGTNFFVRKFLDKRLKFISSLLNLKKGSEAIDVGCGSGVFSKLLLKGGVRVTAVDYSEEMLNICKEALKYYNTTDLALVNCDATDLKFPDNKFDLLISIGLLDYVDNVAPVIKEFSRVAKKDGSLIFTLPKRYSPFFFLRHGIGNYIRSSFLRLPPIITTVSINELKNLLSDSGLCLEKIASLYMTMWIIKCRKV
ncbi:glycosyltransferase [Candidatus Omnitrophota bacterium]